MLRRLAFIRDPVVFNKTIIPVARCTLLGSALPQRALLAILCNNLEGNYMRTGRTEAGTKIESFAVVYMRPGRNASLIT